MLFSFLNSGDMRSALISVLLTIPTVMISLSLHESAHGYVAYKMGDHTAFNLGRVTLNPLKHLDPIGTLCMLLFGYGWAKPVPINSRNFKDPKKGMALTALAGPMANLILGIIGVFFYYLTLYVANTDAVFEFIIKSNTAFVTVQMIISFFYYFAFLNFVYMVFNLIPVPPFDGSRIFSAFLPTKIYFSIMKYERYYLIAVLLISMICSRIFNFSPFGWLADKVFDLISFPINLLFSLIF